MKENDSSEKHDKIQRRVSSHRLLGIKRIRYTYDFVSPFLVNCSKEILFFNNGHKPISKIEFNLGSFLKNLHIFDSDGCSLEFHKNIRDYEKSEMYDDKSVIIQLPESRPIEPKTFRTLNFDYLDEVIEYIDPKKSYFIFECRLEESPRIYILINSSLTKFKLIKHYFIRGKDGRLFNPEELDESEDVHIQSTQSTLHFRTGKEIKGCVGVLAFRFKIDDKEVNWFNLGIFLGFATFFINLILIAINPENMLSIIIPSVALVNTFLLITKGWLFQYDMDRMSRWVGKIRYDSVYVALIYGLIFEVIIAVIVTLLINHFYINFDLSLKMILNSTNFTSLPLGKTI